MMQQLLHYVRQALSAHYPASEANALARLILEKRFGVSLTDIYMGKDKQFSPEQRKDLEDILQRLLRDEPIQYILGEADFCGETFAVTPAVLIPRPETAELVAWIGETLPAAPCRVLDVGTGSGCIAISLAKQHPATAVTAWDISEEALAVARWNNESLGTSVTFLRRDALAEGGEPPRKDGMNKGRTDDLSEEESPERFVPEETLVPSDTSGERCDEAKDLCPRIDRDDCDESGKYDVIVSNPPYVTCSERREMEANVLDWEPGLALFVPDDDPLLFYRAIARLAHRLLKPGGRLFFEINRAYGLATVEMLRAMNYQDVELRKDLSGNDRMVSAKL